MTDTVSLDDLAARILAMAGTGDRRLVAVAGAPGSGKSTLVEALQARIAATRPGLSAILPMDGFHLDDGLLRDRGRLPWKGAPDTFDVGGLRSVLDRLRGPEPEILVPVFDRALEISRGAARVIGAEARLILVEGNYLLLDRAPWDALAPFFDLTVMIRVPEAELARRLARRWEGMPEDEIRRRIETNDLPNGRTVRDDSRPADLILCQD